MQTTVMNIIVQTTKNEHNSVDDRKKHNSAEQTPGEYLPFKIPFYVTFITYNIFLPFFTIQNTSMKFSSRCYCNNYIK